MAEAGLAAQRTLVAALTARFGATLIETHISFVLLAGEHAYKIKKAVDLGFVDFRPLAQREFFCREELRLNRRTAPELYLDVLPIVGTPDAPWLSGTPEAPAPGGEGPAIEWVLRMRAFAQDDLWDRLAVRGALSGAHIDALADSLGAFHAAAEAVAPDSDFGRPAQVRAPMLDNLRVLGELCGTAHEHAALATLAHWEAQTFAALRDTFERRRREGRVRDVHGDLHLGNVTQFEGRTLLFDCLEFSAELRCTDVASDVAFMAMDLHAHGLHRLAHRFINAWVERSGDVDSLAVLRYYAVHRALVRAKVAALRAAQLGRAEPRAAQVDVGDTLAVGRAAKRSMRHYLLQALRGSRPPEPVLMLTHGLSGSGKTTLTQSLLELCGAVRLRADVERKRLFGLGALDRSDAALKTRLYSSQASRATQTRLREQAARALQAGWPVILDATFLAFEARQRARELATTLGVRFVIIDFRASMDTLRERVGSRHGDASEADLDILEQQRGHAEPLTPQELAEVFIFDAEPSLNAAHMAERWAPLLRRLGFAPALPRSGMAAP